MSRKNDIEALLSRAEKTLPKIKEEYENSLHSKEISADLRIDIKDYFGNLRSALDYMAHDIVEKYCPNAKANDVLYFPIRSDQAGFDAMMSKSYPDLKDNHLDIYTLLESIQPFKKPENIWLDNFNKLNNENKHKQLVAQKRTETKRVNVNIQSGGSVNWDPSAVKFGAGVFIGGVPVNPHTQMPVPSTTQTVTLDTWVDFQFPDINVSAISLTHDSLKHIQAIYSELKDKI